MDYLKNNLINDGDTSNFELIKYGKYLHNIIPNSMIDWIIYNNFKYYIELINIEYNISKIS